MPKKFPSKVDKLYAENIKQQFNQVAQNQKMRQAQHLGVLNSFLQNAAVPNSPEVQIASQFMSGFLLQLNRHQEQRDRVADLERDVIASRLKQESGIKLGFREKLRLRKNEKKLAGMNAQRRQADQELSNYYAHAKLMSNQWLPFDPRHQYLEGIKSVFEDAMVTPGEEMLKDSDNHILDAAEAIGYQLEYTKDETRDMGKEIAELETDNESVNEQQEAGGMEDVIDAMEGAPVKAPEQNPNMAFSDMTGRPVNSFPPPDKKTVNLGLKSPTAQVANQPKSAAPAQPQNQKVGSKGFTDLMTTQDPKTR